jgi:putative endonuclease
MFVVYALYSKTFDKIYIGFTSNMEERFKSHNELAKKGWTIKFGPWQIVHQESFSSKAEAMKREKELKTATGRKFIRSLINLNAKL